ncbi:Uncharacterized protein APZ42_024603 [Daphnia magna]|uniref:Uncharacterized protein n=1 Tax=Daphnia magna TaxID=35525 RepID=A0A164TWK9_9CRUS|nr:Uncharacterized protein APZ42_024603 [Daphnia magna]
MNISAFCRSFAIVAALLLASAAGTAGFLPITNAYLVVNYNFQSVCAFFVCVNVSD